MMKSVMNAAVAVAVVGASSVALAKDGIYFSPDRRLAFAAPSTATKIMPHYIRKSKAATIYSNLASAYPNGLYFSGEGSTLYGGSGGSQYVAAGFTPAADATAVEAQAAVGNFGDGNDSFVMSIYSDSAGIPGKALASVTITATAAFGTCCGVVTGTFKKPVALKGGTPYWLAITLNKKQSNSNDDGAWNLATTDQVDNQPFAYNPNGEGWMAFPTILPPAFGVFSE